MNENPGKSAPDRWNSAPGGVTKRFVVFDLPGWFGLIGGIPALISSWGALKFSQRKIIKTDMQIDALDPGIKLFLREKMADDLLHVAEKAAVSAKPISRPS